jgi:hypothetical protein
LFAVIIADLFWFLNGAVRKLQQTINKKIALYPKRILCKARSKRWKHYGEGLSSS